MRTATLIILAFATGALAGCAVVSAYAAVPSGPPETQAAFADAMAALLPIAKTIGSQTACGDLSSGLGEPHHGAERAGFATALANRALCAQVGTGAPD